MGCPSSCTYGHHQGDADIHICEGSLGAVIIAGCVADARAYVSTSVGLDTLTCEPNTTSWPSIVNNGNMYVRILKSPGIYCVDVDYQEGGIGTITGIS